MGRGPFSTTGLAPTRLPDRQSQCRQEQSAPPLTTGHVCACPSVAEYLPLSYPHQAQQKTSVILMSLALHEAGRIGGPVPVCRRGSGGPLVHLPIHWTHTWTLLGPPGSPWGAFGRHLMLLSCLFFMPGYSWLRSTTRGQLSASLYSSARSANRWLKERPSASLKWVWCQLSGRTGKTVWVSSECGHATQGPSGQQPGCC